MSKSKPHHDNALYRKVLRLRSVQEMDLGAIAKKLRIDPREVTPLLSEATKWMLRENSRLSRNVAPAVLKSPIEQKLLTRFTHLKDVFVVPGGAITKPHEYDELLARWAEMAAIYLDHRAEASAAAGEELHVCMSGGETILEVVNSLPVQDRENVFYYASAVVGRCQMVDASHVDAIANVTVAWSRSGRYGGRCIYATITPYDLSDTGRDYDERRKRVAEEIDQVSEIPLIQNYLVRNFKNMDIAIAGLGSVVEPENDSLRGTRFTATSLLKSTAHIDRKDLLSERAVGEIGYCYFDCDGRGDNDKWRFYLTAGDHDPELRGVGFYRGMVEARKDVMVVAGAFKEPTILAALKGKLFNVWFTNEDAASKILRTR